MAHHSSAQQEEAGSSGDVESNPYERERAQRIARNKAVMASMGLDEAPAALRRAAPPPPRRAAPLRPAARQPAAPTRRSGRLRNERPAFGPERILACGPSGPSPPVELTNLGPVPEAWRYEYRGPLALLDQGDQPGPSVEEGEREPDTPGRAGARKRGRPALSPVALAARERANELSKQALRAKDKGDVAAHHQLNYDRIRSMSIAALTTRARRITNKGKLVSFRMVLEDLARPEHAPVLETVRQRLLELTC